METILSDLYYQCYDSFQCLHAALSVPEQQVEDQMPRKTVESEFDKFRLWAGNVGAIHFGDRYQLSLDYRLRESPFYRDRVVSFLNNLKDNTSRATAIVTKESIPLEALEQSQEMLNDSNDDPSTELSEDDEGLDDSPWEVSSEGSTTISEHNPRDETNREMDASSPPTHRLLLCQNDSRELPQILAMVQFLVTCLYKMPIRQPAPLERLKNKLSGAASHYQHFDVLYVRDVFPQMDPVAATRLGRLISLRRHILAYRDSHDRHLQADATPLAPRSSVQQESEPIVTSVPEVAQPESLPAQSQAPSQQISLPSKATTHRNEDSHTDDESYIYPPSVAPSETSRASSYAIDHLQVPIPPIPKDSSGKPLTHFLCPFCSITQNIKSERSWKQHLFKDLQPYVCTYTSCGLQDHFFSSRNEWYQHETLEHRSIWHCNVDSHQQYAAQDEFIRHMSEKHNSKFSSDQLENLASMFRRPSRNPEGVCNMCFRSSQNLRSHVGRHLQRIALFALPRINDEANLNSAEAQESNHRSNGSKHNIEILNESTPSSKSSLSTASMKIEHVSFGTNTGEDTTEEIIEETYIPDSADPEWDLMTTKFSAAREANANINSRGTYQERQFYDVASMSEEDLKRFHDFMERLRTPDQDIRSRLISDAYPGTFEWLFREPVPHHPSLFVGWLKSEAETYCHIQGKPGSGKSTLMKHIFQHDMTRQHLGNIRKNPIPPGFKRPVFIAKYYFGDMQFSHVNNMDVFFESLLFQLFSQFPGLISHIALLLESHPWHHIYLSYALCSALKGFAELTTLLLVDGIDESGCKDDVLKFFRDAYAVCPHLKICFTSSGRNEALDMTGLLGTTIEIERWTPKDFSVFWSYETGHSSDSETASALITKSSGSFLWLKFILKLLPDTGAEEFARIVHKVPPDLAGMYRFMLDYLDPKVREKTIRPILVMLAAHKPLRLCTLLACDTSLDHAALGELIYTMTDEEATTYLGGGGLFKALTDITQSIPFRRIVYFGHDSTRRALQAIKYDLRENSVWNQNGRFVACTALLDEIQLYITLKDHINVSSSTILLVLDDLGIELRHYDCLVTDSRTTKVFIERLKGLLSQIRTLKKWENDRLGDPNLWRLFVVEYSLENFIRSNIADIGVQGLLVAALRTPIYPAYPRPNPNVIYLLLDNGANPNEPSQENTAWQLFLLSILEHEDEYDLDKREIWYEIAVDMIRHGAKVDDVVTLPTKGTNILAIDVLRKALGRDLLKELDPLFDLTPSSTISGTASEHASFSEDDQSDVLSVKEELAHPPRLVTTALFTLEEITDMDAYDDNNEIVQPTAYEEPESIRGDRRCGNRVSLDSESSSEEEGERKFAVRIKRPRGRTAKRKRRDDSSEGSDSASTENEDIVASTRPLTWRFKGLSDRRAMPDDPGELQRGVSSGIELFPDKLFAEEGHGDPKGLGEAGIEKQHGPAHGPGLEREQADECSNSARNIDALKDESKDLSASDVPGQREEPIAGSSKSHQAAVDETEFEYDVDSIPTLRGEVDQLPILMATAAEDGDDASVRPKE